jgi:hypothetical protein
MYMRDPQLLTAVQRRAPNPSFQLPDSMLNRLVRLALLGRYHYSASASGGSATGGISNDQKGAADHRTIEVSDDIVKDCHNSNLVITQNPSAAKYILDFRRQGGRRSTMFALGGLGGLALSAAMKVDGAGLYLQNGDMVKSAKARSVDGVIKELCGSMQ